MKDAYFPANDVGLEEKLQVIGEYVKGFSSPESDEHQLDFEMESTDLSVTYDGDEIDIAVGYSGEEKLIHYSVNIETGDIQTPDGKESRIATLQSARSQRQGWLSPQHVDNPHFRGLVANAANERSDIRQRKKQRTARRYVKEIADMLYNQIEQHSVRTQQYDGELGEKLDELHRQLFNDGVEGKTHSVFNDGGEENSPRRVDFRYSGSAEGLGETLDDFWNETLEMDG